METKHTPGPWKITSATHPIIGWRITANDGSVAGVHKAGPRQSINECKANARLIAAAPELAEALRALYGTAKVVDAQNKAQYERPCGFAPELLEQARAALAKLEGD